MLYLSFSISQGGKTSGGRAAMIDRHWGKGVTSGHVGRRGTDAFIVGFVCHISSPSGRIAGFFDVLHHNS